MPIEKLATSPKTRILLRLALIATIAAAGLTLSNVPAAYAAGGCSNAANDWVEACQALTGTQVTACAANPGELACNFPTAAGAPYALKATCDLNGGTFSRASAGPDTVCSCTFNNL